MSVTRPEMYAVIPCTKQAMLKLLNHSKNVSKQITSKLTDQQELKTKQFYEIDIPYCQTFGHFIFENTFNSLRDAIFL